MDYLLYYFWTDAYAHCLLMRKERATFVSSVQKTLHQDNLSVTLKTASKKFKFHIMPQQCVVSTFAYKEQYNLRTMSGQQHKQPPEVLVLLVSVGKLIHAELVMPHTWKELGSYEG